MASFRKCGWLLFVDLGRSEGFIEYINTCCSQGSNWDGDWYQDHRTLQARPLLRSPQYATDRREARCLVVLLLLHCFNKCFILNFIFSVSPSLIWILETGLYHYVPLDFGLCCLLLIQANHHLIHNVYIKTMFLNHLSGMSVGYHGPRCQVCIAKP